ncbi:hypothetical protein DV735_g3216, partial [Chaetothyriales sp. CBS 134920]
MLINSSTTVQIRIDSHSHSPPSRLALTPYLPVHVPRYHAWMQDPTIRELTASDPLTLAEEYAMQRSWRADADKLTFIVYYHHSSIDKQGKRNQQLQLQLPSEEDMVGDVNLNKIEYLRVRIAKDNIPSLKLFQGLGFKRTSAEPNYFGEVEMRRYPSSLTAAGWEEEVREMMRQKQLEGWEEMQIHLPEQ